MHNVWNLTIHNLDNLILLHLLHSGLICEASPLVRVPIKLIVYFDKLKEHVSNCLGFLRYTRVKSADYSPSFSKNLQEDSNDNESRPAGCPSGFECIPTFLKFKSSLKSEPRFTEVNDVEGEVKMRWMKIKRMKTMN